MRNDWWVLVALAIAGAAHAQADKAADEERKLQRGDPRPPGGAAVAPRKAPQTGPVRGPSQAAGGSGPPAPAAAEREQEALKRIVQPR